MELSSLDVSSNKIPLVIKAVDKNGFGQDSYTIQKYCTKCHCRRKCNFNFTCWGGNFKIKKLGVVF